MQSFQFDECYNDPDIVAGCNGRGQCVALEYPCGLKGYEDDEMLPILMASSNPLVTTDHLIVDKHRGSIPVSNPGVIIIRYRRLAKTMTHSDASKLIEKFKQNYPAWHETNWQGVRLDITEHEIFVSSILDETYESIFTLIYSDKFTEEMQNALSIIAEKYLTSPSSPLSC